MKNNDENNKKIIMINGQDWIPQSTNWLSITKLGNFWNHLRASLSSSRRRLLSIRGKRRTRSVVIKRHAPFRKLNSWNNTNHPQRISILQPKQRDRNLTRCASPAPGNEIMSSLPDPALTSRRFTNWRSNPDLRHFSANGGVETIKYLLIP